MAIVVEDGTGLMTSNAYASVSWVDTYHADHGNPDWLGSEEQKAAWVIQGAEYIDLMWGEMFQGMKKEVDPAQAMEWPREYVYDDNTSVEVDSDSVPDQIMRANAELARVAKKGLLYPENDQPSVRRKRQQAGRIVVEMEYSGSDVDIPVIRKVKLLLRGLMKGSSGQSSLVRA